MEQQTRVLVVEDDPLLQEKICSQILALRGMTLGASFSSRSAAVAWIERHPVDLLLTDIGLPDGSGLDVIRACATLQPGCEILVITTYGDEASILAAIDAGARGYILKNSGPLDIARFFSELKQGGFDAAALKAAGYDAAELTKAGFDANALKAAGFDAAALAAAGFNTAAIRAIGF